MSTRLVALRAVCSEVGPDPPFQAGTGVGHVRQGTQRVQVADGTGEVSGPGETRDLVRQSGTEIHILVELERIEAQSPAADGRVTA
ncbi:MAG: hypothetical protein JWM16_24 [Verrucomicrobiales bacterium]|nr:hypothetical protein [Verrucomicrobiales bacterium]